MPAFPTATLDRDRVKVRFLEPSTPRALNQRPMPRGVYLGYEPFVAPGARLLQLLRDPFHNFSTLKVGGAIQVDIFTNEEIGLDFTGHTVWPIYVLATADYTQGRVTNGRIFTRATPPTGLDEVLICKIDRSGADLVVLTDVPAERQPPLAFEGQRFGFMGGGAISELATALGINAEVVAARTSTYTGVHTSLKERIDADVTGPALGTRLGLYLHNIAGNAYTGVSGPSWNVSGSFAETSREFEPKLTYTPNASESTEGAVTAPGDTTRNLCFLIDETTGNRIVDEVNPSPTTPSLEPVYGRVAFLSGTNGVGKQIHFTNASDEVNGGGTNPFIVPLQQGDLVQGPDGKFYELRTILGPDDAILGSAYQSPNGFVSDTPYRRFTLSFFNSTGAYSIPSPKTIRLAFPAFLRHDRSVFDGLLYMRRAGELPAVGAATTALAGKVLQATAGAKAGTVSAENNGSPVGSNFHTVDFLFGGATDAGGGVANISVPGATGPAGANSNVGPPGATGPAGAGYVASAPFVKSPVITVPTPGSFTNDFAVSHGFATIAMPTGGFAQFTSPIGGVAEITAFFKTPPSSVTITFVGFNPGATYAVFVGACSP